ncbi:MAG: hypothetical protein U0V02_03685 [Anaerolineales bacterium]
MGDYNRSTREISIEYLPAETKQTLNEFIERYNLGSILDGVLLCVESTSEKIKKGLFAGPLPKLVKATVIITPLWLLEVLKVDDKPAYARAAQLRDITISDWEKDPMYAKMPDTGVHVTGMFLGTAESSSSFFGVGKDAAGEKFKEVLIKSAQDAKK